MQHSNFPTSHLIQQNQRFKKIIYIFSFSIIILIIINIYQQITINQLEYTNVMMRSKYEKSDDKNTQLWILIGYFSDVLEQQKKYLQQLQKKQAEGPLQNNNHNQYQLPYIKTSDITNDTNI